jgi:hypothetical protein
VKASLLVFRDIRHNIPEPVIAHFINDYERNGEDGARSVVKAVLGCCSGLEKQGCMPG